MFINFLTQMIPSQTLNSSAPNYLCSKVVPASFETVELSGQQSMPMLIHHKSQGSLYQSDTAAPVRGTKRRRMSPSDKQAYMQPTNKKVKGPQSGEASMVLLYSGDDIDARALRQGIEANAVDDFQISPGLAAAVDDFWVATGRDDDQWSEGEEEEDVEEDLAGMRSPSSVAEGHSVHRPSAVQQHFVPLSPTKMHVATELEYHRIPEVQRSQEVRQEVRQELIYDENAFLGGIPSYFN